MEADDREDTSSDLSNNDDDSEISEVNDDDSIPNCKSTRVHLFCEMCLPNDPKGRLSTISIKIPTINLQQMKKERKPICNDESLPTYNCINSKDWTFFEECFYSYNADAKSTTERYFHDWRVHCCECHARKKLPIPCQLKCISRRLQAFYNECKSQDCPAGIKASYLSFRRVLNRKNTKYHQICDRYRRLGRYALTEQQRHDKLRQIFKSFWATYDNNI